MKIPLVDLKSQHDSYRNEIDLAVKSVIDSSSFILGPETKKFEENFAKFCRSKYCIGVDSGFSALELGMRAIGIQKGDEVITPVNSFIASSSAISVIGAKPVWIDIDEKTYNLDVDQIEKKITGKTKAIMPVHLYGQAAEMDKIIKIAKKHNLKIIEDACQAHGAEYKGKSVGTFGNFAAFSFYPGKNLGALGDGGAIVTNSLKIAQEIQKIRHYGQKEKHKHVTFALNRRLDSIHAAVLSVKLKYLKKGNSKRIAAASKYSKLLKDLPLILPKVAPHRYHVFHLYVIQTKKRNKLLEYLRKNGIEAAVHYPTPIHLQKTYKYMNFKKGDFPVSEQISGRIISLPIFPEITENQIEYISDNIKKFFKNN